MAINPSERISHEELFDYVTNDDFMNENIIYLNNQESKYEKIYNEIENIKNSEKYEKLLKKSQTQELSKKLMMKMKDLKKI